jgi:tetratricopeptide (TPR) repeat protein
VALNPQRGRRRRYARWILAGLIVAHALALIAYWQQNRQQVAVVRFLDARTSWRDGRLDDAAYAYRQLLNERAALAFPVVLVQHFPTAADLAYLLGRVESDRHATDAALSAYAEAIAQGGRGAREYRNLLLESGRPADLLRWSVAASERDPGAPQSYKDRGAALLALGRPAEAQEAYRAALQRLPAWRQRVDPGAPPGLSGEEADLWNLYSAAALRAGDTDTADRACATVSARQSATVHLDRLCRALLAAAAGHRTEAQRLLEGYLPPAPEHEALTDGLSVRP